VIAVASGWRVHAGTAGATVVRLVSRPGSGGGWAVARLLAGAAGLGASAAASHRALGAGTGPPLIHSAALRWRGCDLHLECHHDPAARRDELSLELPGWDELAALVPDESLLWELLDAAAVAVDAEHGCIGDGEALDPDLPADERGWRRRCRSHLGVLAPERVEGAGSEAASYLVLPLSGLRVLLR
jgi:hypothetical protein